MASVLETLQSSFSEVEPLSFYHSLFPSELMEKRGEYVSGKYCGIALQIREDGKARRVHLTKGLPELESLIESVDFSMVAPVLFAGKEASNDNARFLTAIEFDLDFLRKDKEGNVVGIDDLLYQTSLSKSDTFNRLPKPTYLILSSSRNLHVVYQLEKPLPMYPEILRQVRSFRRAFIPKLWDSWITEAFDAPQFETSPVQAFRLVGSKSKGHKDKVRAFLTGDPVSVEYLNSYVDEKSRIKLERTPSTYTLEECRKLFPEWYSRKIEKRMDSYSWEAHVGLYRWWKSRLNEVRVGHRYHYLLCMTAYAYKCGVSFEEVQKDVMAARKKLDELSPPSNPLTMSDAAKALQVYSEKYRRMKRDTISKLSGLEIPERKRNHRRQAQHLAILNASNNAKRQFGEQVGGSKSKREEIVRYKKQSPEATVREIADQLGCSKTTVQKWVSRMHLENDSERFRK